MGRGVYRLKDVRDPTKSVSRVNGVHLRQSCRTPLREVSIVRYNILLHDRGFFSRHGNIHMMVMVLC